MTTLTLVSFLIWSPGLILPHYPQPPMYTTSSPSPRDTTGITSKNNERTFYGKKCALQLETHTHTHTQQTWTHKSRGQGEKRIWAETYFPLSLLHKDKRVVPLPRFSLTAKTVGSYWGKRRGRGASGPWPFPTQLEKGLSAAVLIWTRLV